MDGINDVRSLKSDFFCALSAKPSDRSQFWSDWQYIISRSERRSCNKDVYQDIRLKNSINSYYVSNPLGHRLILCTFVDLNSSTQAEAIRKNML
jgi:hypothetical protein